MTQQDKERLKLEIYHIFESGAIEIRIFEMVVNFIDSRNGVNKNFVLSDVRSSDDGSILGSTDAFTLVERVLKSCDLKDVQNGKYQDELAREIVNFLVIGGWMK